MKLQQLKKIKLKDVEAQAAKRLDRFQNKPLVILFICVILIVFNLVFYFL